MQQGDQRDQGEDLLTEQIIGGCIAVHRALGPGLLESAYEHCLARELAFRGIPFRRQAELAIEYRGDVVDCGYRVDLLVADRVVVELKSGNYPIALLVNFNVTSLRQGLRRLTLRPTNIISP